MYSVSLSRSFTASHALTVPDPGPEGDLHDHRYTVETTLSGPTLDEYGYLVDIDHLAAALDELVDAHRGRVLNDDPAFGDENPSVEHFARIFGDRLLERLDPVPATSLRVSMREDDLAWVAHERDL
ncbi:6-pyruvoyl trahydropterin synthase family protein [Natronobiforma cellulositropha]|uniref:6-pyruvoyl trahydropterin synthase family protein n=1 Tax=Natronobiforma cellulositropha TaxID=1679076 RepID=UPI0021D5F9B7|nr:6-carboxytetrahydropterin synthase [Natronobiforma cellulositropha]